MKQKRKGFTLVELLVVITILAILATVSVVGYLSFTEKAKQSNDESLIAQLNTVLQGNEAIDGKPNTMYDALIQVKDSGFLVENLTPTSAKNEFLWNQEENRFIIVAADSLEATSNPSLWVIVNDETTLFKLQDNYSVYLGSKYNDTDGIVNVANGFDAGDYDGITTINFVTDENITVTIRTNGGTLNVDAENATVHHYATAQTLEITAVDNESYHEHGSILGNVYLQQGRFVAENDSTVSNVIVTSITTENVKVVNNATESLNVSATNESVSTSLGNITSGKTNNETTVVDEDTLKLFAGGLGTEESPYLISNEKELLNIVNEKISGEIYLNLIDNIVLDDSLIISKNTYHLNLNEKTITYSFDLNRILESGYIGGIFDLSGSASLLIYGNGVMNFDSNYLSDDAKSIGYTFRLGDNSNLTIKSGSFHGGLTVVQLDNNSTCTIEGGYFSAEFSWNSVYWILNLVDKSNGVFSVKGGTFENYDPSNSSTENPIANFVSDGYVSKKVEGTTIDDFAYVVSLA